MTSTEESDDLSRIAVALDTKDRETFREWCATFGPRVGVLKVGLEAYVRWGPPAVVEAREYAKAIFLDLKLHDIPNTVQGAVEAAAGLGVDYLTVHVGGGPAMLEAAVLAAGDRIKILGVTLLTSLGAKELAALGLSGSSGGRVRRWAHLAREAGCAGVVCSPREVEGLRDENPRPFLLVTPGIRFGSNMGEDDQRRVSSPGEALSKGSDLLVIGRPLTRAGDPKEALVSLRRAVQASYTMKTGRSTSCSNFQ